MGDWVEAWSGDGADLLVIGDGYSHLRSQWVHEWGVELGEERPVQIRHWGEAADITFNEAEVLAEGDGPALTIWSASRAGTTIAGAADRLDDFVDEAGGVDAVLVSLGRDSEGEDVETSLGELVDGIDEDLPVLVVVAPGGLHDPEVAEAMFAWVEEHEDRVSVVDLRKSDLEDPTAAQWAETFASALADD